MIYRAQAPATAVARTLTLAALTALTCFGACGKFATPRPAPPSIGDSERFELYDRADRTFAAGYLLKPAEGSVAESVFDLAPLLLQETTTQGPGAALDFEGTPTVYVMSSSIEIQEHHHEQWTYLWRTPASIETGQGIRVTIGSDGFPAIYEVLADTSGARTIFVTATLEQAAADEFGSPLSGRRFSVERPVDETPNVVVAGVLEPGPVPLGPFVYLTETSHDVSTLLCRCMPSQIEAIVDSLEYRLVELEQLASFEAPVPPWMGVDEARSLERSLRLPSQPL